MILVTHDLEAACVGDRVVVLADGQVTDVLDAPTIDVLTALAGAATDQHGSSGGIPIAGGGTP